MILKYVLSCLLYFFLLKQEHCKSRWKSLCDRFFREATLNKLKSGAAAQERTEWCYMESVRFLTKHISSRK